MFQTRIILSICTYNGRIGIELRVSFSPGIAEEELRLHHPDGG